VALAVLVVEAEGGRFLAWIDERHVGSRRLLSSGSAAAGSDTIKAAIP
jgi:hypothetical protein